MTKQSFLNFNFQVGDILLIDGKGFVADGIEWFSGGAFSHAALYVGGGVQKIIEAVSDGVEESDVATLLKRANSLCVLRVPGLTVEQAEKVKDYAYGLVNLKYDYKQFATLGVYLLVHKLTGWRWSWLVKNSNHKMICSELCAVSLEAGGVHLDYEPKDITPVDLSEMKNFLTVLVGIVE